MYKISEQELKEITDLLDDFLHLQTPAGDLAFAAMKGNKWIRLDKKLQVAKKISQHIKENYTQIKT